ncbi:decarboxylating cobalt-precorrin-6B (C(15))-methyltransferase [Clostridioides mangenotii]|uniref:decarboxylating cobalt-precorrin-6B (C(15))-methyltransferase n=1 Tax=Metaclostridioides mangenotii TaxID=1540 RepID=UPI0021499D8C|nr:decarboxylating cobalt-precorrin-6B (C(15))-methyltransferase [Clostridioides mangenotii]MCR1954975.1 decarboxylating cobalt-precorrin-6B (C(15))-methyltransferase [Clostridioides mangenotii]
MNNSEFITGKVPITKEEVRAISLSKLDLAKAEVFLDVGAGTGSVCVEAGITYPNLEVLAIERDEGAIDLINQNIEKFNLKNTKLIEGYAPLKVEDLTSDSNVSRHFKTSETIDSIFLGGTGGNLEEIILWSKNLLKSGGKLVANFIIVDTFNNALKLLREHGFKEIDVSVLNVSKLEKLGRGEYFKPLNPIYIISCEKGE